MKILVIDDEQLAIDNLVSLLQSHAPESEIIASDDAGKAIDLFFSETPDVTYLDINMPRMSGIDLAKIFTGKSIIVFVTAYSEFAIEAFDLSAIDYLLKPIDEKRFAESFHRVKERIQKPTSETAQLKDVFDLVSKQLNSPTGDVIPVKEVGKIRIIEINNIDYLLGSGNYVEIYLQNGQMILHRETMQNMESRLNRQAFIRIHRSSIVRISAISELIASSRGDYTAKLKCGTKLPVSRQLKNQVLSFFS
ncbi:LytR/AlgR family response regulator transcription factor [Planctobacterium marinum]|uniref:DNA-binding response regulator n=1 Tax=Planctobacterium marinum TaxID=1631968 RepID=A0AA48HP12_9ALTE|nr:DNA-binding response regulator [Planctobacterium marinum]